MDVMKSRFKFKNSPAILQMAAELQQPVSSYWQGFCSVRNMQYDRIVVASAV